MDIVGQPIWVTGAASGLGAAVAQHLAQQGGRPVLIDRDERVQEQASLCDGEAYLVDVTDADAVAALREQAPVPRALINCAGIAPAERLLSREGDPMPLQHFAKVVQVNLLGTFNVMRIATAAMATLEPLIDNERGVVINTASIAAYEGQVGQMAYSAAKGGVIAMTLPAARELARHGIRVMAIAPGLVATPLLLNMPEKVQTQLQASVPFPQRLAEPHEFACLVAYILSHRMLNGSVIRMDGALRMS